MPVLDVKTFHPSEDEFKDMASLLKHIEADTQCIETGMAKVSCNFVTFASCGWF